MTNPQHKYFHARSMLRFARKLHIIAIDYKYQFVFIIHLIFIIKNRESTIQLHSEISTKQDQRLSGEVRCANGAKWTKWLKKKSNWSGRNTHRKLLVVVAERSKATAANTIKCDVWKNSKHRQIINLFGNGIGRDVCVFANGDSRKLPK